MNLGRETETVEFKKTTSELREGIESIASILNKHGAGELYFGVRDDGEVTGQDVAGSTLRRVSQAVASSISPTIHPSVERLDDDEGRSYIRVSFVGREAPYSCHGRFRTRVADEDVPMSQEEIGRMFLYARTHELPWDEWESDRPIRDIDEEELRAFVSRGNACGRIEEPFASVEATLEGLGLLRGDHLTNAAEVLFCTSRDVELKMGILATHARTEILDLHQESGTLFELVRKAQTYILNNTRRRFVIKGMGPREEIPEIPTDAVREILINAYTHRDWLSSGCVQIDIYNDSVEVFNPGWFIEGQDPEAHLSGKSRSSLTRNELIARTLYRSKDIESYASGIPRVRDLCANANIRIEYQRMADGTNFVFHRNDAFADKPPTTRRQTADNPPTTRRQPAEPLESQPPAWRDMPENDRLVYQYLLENGSSRTSDIARTLKVSPRTLRDVMRRLSERGVVVAHGANRNRTYDLAPRARDASSDITERPCPSGHSWRS